MEQIPLHRTRLHKDRWRWGDIPRPCLSKKNLLLKNPAACPAITVAFDNGDFVVLTGEAWWLAAQAAGLDEIPAQIAALGERDAAALARSEVGVGKNDPIALAKTLHRAWNQHNLSMEMTARQYGVGRSHAAHLVRLLDLPESVQRLISTGALSVGQGKCLVRLEDKPDVMVRVAEKIAGKHWSVRKTEALVKQMISGEIISGQQPCKQPEHQGIERAVAEQLGVPAEIQWVEGQGVLILKYHNLDVLDGLLKKMGINLEL